MHACCCLQEEQAREKALAEEQALVLSGPQLT